MVHLVYAGNNSNSSFRDFLTNKNIIHNHKSPLYYLLLVFFVKNNRICYKIRETTELVVSELVSDPVSKIQVMNHNFEGKGFSLKLLLFHNFFSLFLRVLFTPIT